MLTEFEPYTPSVAFDRLRPTTGADVSLIDDDILLLGENLLRPFDTESVKGASYDIRVGDKVEFSAIGNGREHRVVRTRGGPVKIHPGEACTIESCEELFLPLDMKGRLFLRSFYALKLMQYNGGLIDPGFSGKLKIPVANLSDAEIEVKYGERLVTAEFSWVRKTALPYEHAGPTESGKVVAFDRFALSGKVKEQADRLEKTERELRNEIDSLKRKVDEQGHLVGSSQRILDVVLLGAIAGAGSAAFSAVVGNVSPLVGMAGKVTAAVVVAILFYWVVLPKRRR